MSRVPFICGNWKMNKTVGEGLELVDGLLAGAASVDGVEIGIAPPAVSLHPIKKRLEGSKIRLAAQNVHWEAEGAYTGEVSVGMLRHVGCEYTLVGHSERRQYFGETDETCARKIGAALAGGLRVIYCIGETLDEREAGRHFDVVQRQLSVGLAEVSGDQAADIVLAYEPVWAIGTGKTATPEQAQEMHAKIREEISGRLGGDAGAAMRIQYGGSMKPANAAELLAQADIDGGLIGGASLKAETFLDICRAAAS